LLLLGQPNTFLTWGQRELGGSRPKQGFAAGADPVVSKLADKKARRLGPPAAAAGGTKPTAPDVVDEVADEVDEDKVADEVDEEDGRGSRIHAQLTRSDLGSVALSLQTAVHPRHGRSTKRFGAAVSETAVRPDPRSDSVVAKLNKKKEDRRQRAAEVHVQVEEMLNAQKAAGAPSGAPPAAEEPAAEQGDAVMAMMNKKKKDRGGWGPQAGPNRVGMLPLPQVRKTPS
jgi:hypothetical protein